MVRTVLQGGSVYDGGLSAARPADVVVEGDRIVEVAPSAATRPGDVLVDATGYVVMPGLVEGHSHLTFPSGVGSLELGFSPPVDVSYLMREHSTDELRTTAARNARLLLDAGFTSAYSAGSLITGETEVWLRDAIARGEVAGPRLRAASTERDNHFVGHGGDKLKAEGDPEGVAAFVRKAAAAGSDNVKLLLSNDDVFTEGGSQITQYSEAEARAAHEAALEAGVFLNCHSQAAESVKIAVRNGFRAIYHCFYADEEAIDLLEEHRDRLFVGPAVGIIWANIYEGEEFGIDRAAAEKMGLPAALEAMSALYPKLRERGIRIVPGGDHGFPQNPNGRNARDLGLFVRLFGFSPIEALHSATAVGGELLDRPDEIGRLAPGYLADILVVAGDPMQDVTVLEDPANLLAIIKDGQFHKVSDRIVRLPADPPSR